MSVQASFPGMEAVAYGDELDHWSTPRWAVEAIVPVLRDRLMEHRIYSRVGWHIVDPGCGRGVILETMLNSGLGVPIKYADGLELHAGRAAEARERLRNVADVHHVDFLSWSRPREMAEETPLLVTGNPPYSRALEFVEHSIKLAEPDGIVAMLLQLDFATGVDRGRFHDKHKSGLYPLRRRPNFGGEHSSGQRPFSWFVWDLDEPFSEWGVL